MPALPRILMLEDDPDDRFITETTLRELGHQVSVSFVQSSVELLDELQQGPRPRLILIDQACLPMPSLQLLQHLKSHDAYRGIPVIILGETTPYKAAQFYAHGAASYICKPDTPARTTGNIDLFFRYWLNVAEVPL